MYRKKIGISMLGGGMRCVAYAGMLKAFEEENIPVEALIGTSGGALVAAAYAFGKTPDEIFEHFLEYNFFSLLNPFKIIRDRDMYSTWREFISKLISPELNIEDSKIKLAIHVTGIDKLESEYLSKGSAVEAVVASSAFGFPYRFGDKRYIDGDYDPETGHNKLKSLDSNYTILTLTEYKNKPIILPLRAVQANAIELDMKVHPMSKVFRIQLDNGSLMGSKPIRENYYHGYLQAQEFIKKNLNQFHD